MRHSWLATKEKQYRSWVGWWRVWDEIKKEDAGMGGNQGRIQRNQRQGGSLMHGQRHRGAGAFFLGLILREAFSGKD